MTRAPVAPGRLGSCRVLPCPLPQQSEGGCGGVIPASPARTRCRQGQLRELIGRTLWLSKWSQDRGYVLLMSLFKELTEAKPFVKPGRPLWPAGRQTF